MASSNLSPRAGESSHSSDAFESTDTHNIMVADFSSPRLRKPRTLPPWIDSYEERYGPGTPDQFNLLRPPNAVPARHNAAPDHTQRRVSKDGYIDYDDPKLGPAQDARHKIPHFLRYGRASMRGRKWDHLRSAEPVVVPRYHSTSVMTTDPGFRQFVHSSAYGPMEGEVSERVDPDYLEKLQPTFNLPARGAYNALAAGRKSKRTRTVAFNQRVWNLVMRHSLSPAICRLTVMVTSIVALGVASRIFVLEDNFRPYSAERTQSIVAIVVDCVAIPYIGYMIYDEYTGQPLGLRSARNKVSLVLLDLVFIIFKSASTALAFESLVYHNVADPVIRKLAKALAAFMLLALTVWTINFTINIFRIVERLGGGEDEHHRRS
ncbi:Regulator of phospholipase D-like protein [Emericellopsis cladophorae]|uniref:Regulator of phospholipase D-like protein n=1 Tax=Emericellopsis cladophorae TaxID=2686198 RepID=A0A9Q0BDP4_9HYPO|nr:Regulator of phospholipase D-like protein [Emericellopsis cladophorae]KAI6782102.1 Regulator of phospholipase D-like protein [Emericellopsis cladophorae]